MKKLISQSLLVRNSLFTSGLNTFLQSMEKSLIALDTLDKLQEGNALVFQFPLPSPEFVTFSVQGHDFMVDSFVVMKSRLLTNISKGASGYNEAVSGVFKVEQMDVAVFEQMLKYLHGNHACLNENTAAELLVASHFLQIPELFTEAASFLWNHMTTDVALEMKAQTPLPPVLDSFIDIWLEKRFQILQKSSEFNTVLLQELASLLKAGFSLTAWPPAFLQPSMLPPVSAELATILITDYALPKCAMDIMQVCFNEMTPLSLLYPDAMSVVGSKTPETTWQDDAFLPLHHHLMGVFAAFLVKKEYTDAAEFFHFALHYLSHMDVPGEGQQVKAFRKTFDHFFITPFKNSCMAYFADILISEEPLERIPKIVSELPFHSVSSGVWKTGIKNLMIVQQTVGYVPHMKSLLVAHLMVELKRKEGLPNTPVETCISTLVKELNPPDMAVITAAQLVNAGLSISQSPLILLANLKSEKEVRAAVRQCIRFWLQLDKPEQALTLLGHLEDNTKLYSPKKTIYDAFKVEIKMIFKAMMRADRFKEAAELMSLHPHIIVLDDKELFGLFRDLLYKNYLREAQDTANQIRDKDMRLEALNKMIQYLLERNTGI